MSYKPSAVAVGLLLRAASGDALYVSDAPAKYVDELRKQNLVRYSVEIWNFGRGSCRMLRGTITDRGVAVLRDLYAPALPIWYFVC